MNRRHRRRDVSHHHPRVAKKGTAWTWACPCGGCSWLSPPNRLSWHDAVVEALRHSTTIAA